MKPLISPAVMRQCKQKYFTESGVKSIDIMENAAHALADAVLSHASITPETRVFIACGTGNNGGDGAACARLLKEHCRCVIVQVGVPKTPDAMENHFRARSCGVPVFTVLPDDQLGDFTAGGASVPYTLPVTGAGALPDRRPDVWVDALLGTGLTRAPEGGVKALIECINRDHDSGACVIAADIPSGLNGQTGQICGTCVRADYTVTFQFCKTGMCLADGLDACGEIEVADVGFPDSAFGPFDAQHADADELLPLLEKRPRNIHKGNCGHLLIVAGSFGMAGAAAMCARAALRSGVGLVTIACPTEIIPILQTSVPQAMCKPLDLLSPKEGDPVGKWFGVDRSDNISDTVKSLLKGKTAVIVGCGMGVPEYMLYEINDDSYADEPQYRLYWRSDNDISLDDACTWQKAELSSHFYYHDAILMLQTLLESGLPMTVDADALNLIARIPALQSCLKPHHIITPHPGEAQRLLRAFRIAERFRSKEITYGCCTDLSCKEILPPELTSDPIAMAAELQKLGATVLYKGASSVIRDEKDVFVSTSGCCGMARGGSGDILAGILGALLAAPGNRSVTQNALIASEIHGVAGAYAQAAHGPYCMNAADIIDFLPGVFPR